MITEPTRRIHAPGGMFDLDSLIAALEEVRLHQRAVGIASPTVLMSNECGISAIDLCELITPDDDEPSRYPVALFVTA